MSISWMPVSDFGSSAAAQTAAAATSTQANQLASKDVFMQLLVAQIKNQNPMSPSDGIQFLTQLTQFSEVEQLTAMRQDMAAVRKSLEASEAAAAETQKQN